MPVCPKCRRTGPEVGASCPRDDYYFVEKEALDEAGRDRRLGTLVSDRFVILDRISEGGMGAVYRALQLPVRRQVALKVLRAELEQSHKIRKRFIREARAISQLTHPNVITLHDFGFDDYDQPFMVMEYAPGQELCDWAHSEELSTGRLVDVTRQLLSALAEAHDQGIVHRDLKPQNVIVTETGRGRDVAKLLDFGIARLVNKETTQGLTADGEVFGTPHYMSPEQARGAGEVGPEADIYAMGVILYECFTGDVPFDADSPLSVLFMHLNEPLPEPVPRQGIELPPGLAEVIYRATEKEAEDRYADAGQMLTAFDESLGLNTDTGSLSISGRFPSAKSGDDDAVARAPTVMLDDDHWEVEEATQGPKGDTLQSHQLDDGGEEANREAESPTPISTPEDRNEEPSPTASPSSSLSPALIAAGVAVVGAVFAVGIGAVVFLGMQDDSAVDGEEGGADTPHVAQAQGESETDDDERVVAQEGKEEVEEEGSPASNSGSSASDDDAPDAEEESVADGEDKSADDEEGTQKAEVASNSESPTGAPSAQDSGEHSPEPTEEDESEPVAAATPSATEESEEEPEEEQLEEEEEKEDSDDDFQPGKFERPSGDSDDGPTKFQRPDEIN